MADKISIDDLFDECLEVYEYDIESLSLHVYTLHQKFNKNVAKAKIQQDLETKKNIEKYRLFFIKVLDSFKTEIEEFRNITKFDIRGCHTSLLYCYENIETIDKLDRLKKVKLEKELVKVLYYTERLLNEVFNGKES
jgi:predicted nucleotidyltransferase